MAIPEEASHDINMGVTTAADPIVADDAETLAPHPNNSETIDSLCEKLETNMEKLKLQLISSKRDGKTVEQERDTLQDERHRLQNENDLLRAQLDTSRDQLRAAEERITQLQGEVQGLLQQVQELVAERKRMRSQLTVVERQYNETRAGLTNMEKNLPWRTTMALMSRVVSEPRGSNMSCQYYSLSVPSHPAFARASECPFWVDLNGELAWVNVLLMVQHDRILAPSLEDSNRKMPKAIAFH